MHHSTSRRHAYVGTFIALIVTAIASTTGVVGASSLAPIEPTVAVVRAPELLDIAHGAQVGIAQVGIGQDGLDATMSLGTADDNASPLNMPDFRGLLAEQIIETLVRTRGTAEVAGARSFARADPAGYTQERAGGFDLAPARQSGAAALGSDVGIALSAPGAERDERERQDSGPAALGGQVEIEVYGAAIGEPGDLGAGTTTETVLVESSQRRDPWAAVRQCESGGNYAINTGNGFYGAYQFTISTWNWVAAAIGRQDLVGLRPDRAAPSDQDRLAQALGFELAGGGLGHWPVCGLRYG